MGEQKIMSKLLSVEVNNFLGFKHAVLPIADQGLVLVLGENLDSINASSNGSGKSCLLVDAVPWCLFGETIREKVFGKTSQEFKADDVVNLDEGKDCFVSVLFESGGHEYCATRYRKHSQFKNKVTLTCEGATLTGETVEETDRKIEALIGMDYQTYCNSAVFAQGSIKRFTQCTDAERRKIMEDFFDFSDFDNALAKAKEDVRDITKAIAEWESKQAQADFELQTVQDSISNLDALRVSTAKTSKVGDLISLKKQLAAAKVRQSKLVLLGQKAIDSKILEKEREFSKLEEKQRTVGGDVAALRRLRSKFRAGETCPECMQVVGEQHVFDHERRTNIVLQKKIAELEGLTEKVNALAIALRDLNEKASHEAAQMKVHRELQTEIARLQATVAAAEGAEEIAKKNIQAIDDKIAAAKKKAADAGKRRSAAIKMQEGMREEKAIAEFWVVGYKAIKDNCYKSLIEHLNELIQKFSSWLTGGEIDIELSKNDSDKLGVKVDVEKSAQSYIMSSNGQMRRVDLCIALAWQAAAEGEEKLNFSIIDEFDAGLDATGVDAFAEFLQTEASRKGSVFVISHNAHMANRFENVLTVRREGGESRIVEA